MTSQDKPQNWLHIGYDVGIGKIKRLAFIPLKFIDVFLIGSQAGSIKRPQIRIRKNEK